MWRESVNVNRCDSPSYSVIMSMTLRECRQACKGQPGLTLCAVAVSSNGSSQLATHLLLVYIVLTYLTFILGHGVLRGTWGTGGGVRGTARVPKKQPLPNPQSTPTPTPGGLPIPLPLPSS